MVSYLIFLRMFVLARNFLFKFLEQSTHDEKTEQFVALVAICSYHVEMYWFPSYFNYYKLF